MPMMPIVVGAETSKLMPSEASTETGWLNPRTSSSLSLTIPQKRRVDFGDNFEGLKNETEVEVRS